MQVIDMLLRLAGKTNLRIDAAVPVGYLLREIFDYACMYMRGIKVKMTGVNSRGRLFIGSKVRIRRRRLLSCGTSVRLGDSVFINALSRDGVVLGDAVLIGKNGRIECTGTLSSVGKGLEIGDRTTFGSDCYFGAAGGINIGADVIAGQYVRFHSENHNYIDQNRLIREQGVNHRGIEIGDNCWIGAGAVFLDGVSLGSGCVVAANAVVTGSFPDNSVIAGVPAKIIKQR